MASGDAQRAWFPELLDDLKSYWSNDIAWEELAVFCRYMTEKRQKIKEARGIKDETPVKKKKHAVKIKMTKPELKARIRELKALRWQALESNENKKVVMLRHQISQLKKKSRRVAAA